MAGSGQNIDFGEISFFELDRLFAASARALRRKLKRKRRRAKAAGADDESESRSRTPKRRVFGRISRLTPFGGFTSAVDKLERTVIAATIPQIADEKSIHHHFSKCGTVTDVKILRTRQNAITGIVVVEFAEDEAVSRACTLPPPHNEFMGQTLQVKRADAQLTKKSGDSQPKRMMTRQQFTQQVLSNLKGSAEPAPGGASMRKLHIKNLRLVVTEEDMRGIFKPFGEFERFEMGSQECWITYVSSSDAQDAMSSMQGFLLVGQQLQISREAAHSIPIVPVTPWSSTDKFEKLNLGTDSDFGAIGTSSFNVQNRLDMMKKLMSSHSDQGVPTVVGHAAPGSVGALLNPSLAALPPKPVPGTPACRTLLLQNMFTPGNVDLQKDPRFFEEIREDTYEECTKFGKVLHLTVDPRGSSGLIYVLFEAPQQRLSAETALNGRWFEGKQVVAQGIDDGLWQSLAAQSQSGGAPAPPPM